jgi:hypothetical protein
VFDQAFPVTTASQKFDFELALPAGSYTLLAQVPDTGSRMVLAVPTNLPLAQVSPLQRYSDLTNQNTYAHVQFFYVPAGVDRVVMYSEPRNHTDPNNSPLVVSAASDASAPVTASTVGANLRVYETSGKTDRLWSITVGKTPDSPIELLNVPRLLAFSPDTALVPKDLAPKP